MGYRWRGFEHPQLYNMINSGPGSAASEPQTVYWKSLTEELGQVDEALNKKLSTMGASWEGQAAERAQSGLTPLAEWAGDAETGSSVMRISSENQADYISDARSRMPPPVKVTTPAPSGWDMATAGLSVLGGNPLPAAQVASQAADHEMQEAAQSEAEQRAVQTMQTYESSSTWNRDTLGTFVAPPDVVVSTPPPQGGTGTAVDGSHSQVNNVSGSSGGSTSSQSHIPTTGPHGAGLTPTGSSGGGPNNLVPGGGTGGSGVALPPAAATSPAGLTPPAGQPPFGQPPVNTLPPGPTPGGNPPLNTGPSLPGQNPGLLPTLNNANNSNLPNTGARGPLNANPNVLPTGGNAGDVARRGVPLRGGLPGGMGGFGGAPGEGGVVRSGPGGAGAAGGRGAGGTAGATAGRGAGGVGGRGGTAGAMGAGGRRGEREDDDEHYAPDYLLETDDIFGDDRRVSPTVIGEATIME